MKLKNSEETKGKDQEEAKKHEEKQQKMSKKLRATGQN